MNKQFKKYSKANWYKTRLSRKYKSRRLFARCQASTALACGIADINAIKAAYGNKADKAIAIINTYIATMEAVSKSWSIKSPN